MVAMNVWPTDAADGAVSSEARWRKMGRVWAPTGAVVGVGGGLAPSLAFPNLTVKSGAAWVDGHYTELPGDQVLPVTANGIAVVRFDPAANTAELLWRDAVSTPTQNPTGVWEFVVAQVTGSALTDKRSFTGGAGVVAGRVHQTAGIGLNANADNDIPMGAVDFLRGGCTMNAGHLQVPVAGLYQITAHLGSMHTTANAGYTGGFLVAAVTSTFLFRTGCYSAGLWAVGGANGTAMLAANDVIKLFVYPQIAAYTDPVYGWQMPSFISAYLIST